MTVVDAITVFCAQILPVMVAATAAGVWLLLPRRAKGRFALASVVALALTAAIVLLAGTLHADPRPFVVDPSQPALFSHAPDNGFPSDHTAYTATIALLVALVRRRLGIALLGLSVAAGAARVLANVHHVQDIAAGLLIAATAVAATFLLLTRMWSHRLDAPEPIQNR